MTEANTWIVVINLHRNCSLSNMFDLPKYGGSLLKMKLRATLDSSCPRRYCTEYDRAIIDITLHAAENEDQNHSCPMREKEDGRVLSLAWMKPRWKPARELDWGIWYQGTGLADAQNAYHSPPGTATVTVWKSLEILVYSRSHLKLLQTLNILDDKAAGPGVKGLYKSKDSICTPEVGLKSILWQEQLVVAPPQNRCPRWSYSPSTVLPGLP